MSELQTLSPREREALTLYAHGHPCKVVADRMKISLTTVEATLLRVRKKLGRNLIQSVVLATKAGWVQ